MRTTTPRIQILNGIAGASEASGIAVIIDVLRAFSTACYAVAQGAKVIMPVARVDEAFALRRQHPDWMIVGERNGRRVAGFDLGNSPDEIRKFGSFNDRIIIQATSNGTRGIAAAGRAEHLVTGGFVNAGAIAAYIRYHQFREVSLVSMGTSAGPAVEDDLCAAYIAGLLRGEVQDFTKIRQQIIAHPSLRRFGAEETPHYPVEDLPLCLVADIFNFVLARKFDGHGNILLIKKMSQQRDCPS